ncbi:H(+)-transporting two-sector ATPase [Dethiobacter alkaliphilus AHT 1]|uniref:H(+)-transporting two-sector ATPase n=2 Tax=Dethiobacter TaxID=427925 RepID=C0GGD1_DETAL|nr:H(+)-transporting two-sector ATPase [Dethiobacter alkaliphilus AHT 1]
MGISKMNKVYLVAHQAEKDQVLAVLQQLGVMEVNDLQAKDLEDEAWADLVEGDQEQEALNTLEERLADVRFSLDFLKRYYPAKKGMLDAINGEKKSVLANELADTAAQWAETTDQVYAALRQVDEKLISLRNEETRLQNLKLQLEPWDKLTVPLEEVKSTNTVRVELGTLPTAELGPVKEELAEAGAAFVLDEVKAERGESYVLVAYHAEDAEEVPALLKQHNFNKHTFPKLSGTPKENLERIEKELVQADKERQEALAAAGEQVKHREQLNYYLDYLTVERDKKQKVASFARTSNSFILEGWIREQDLPELKKKLEKACDTVEVVSREPEEGEAFPVSLENKPAFTPFEFITKLYGTPSPHGLDPTANLTPFFIVFFGLAMTDAGYGVILALVAALALTKIKPQGARNLLWIIFAGGISTFVFGWLVGGWFGADLLGAPLYFSALEDPILLLVYSLALGIIQIFYGMAIKAAWSIREGRILDAVFDQGLWYLLIIGILLMAIMPELGIGGPMAIAAAIGLVLTQGRTQPTIVKKFLSGLLSLYDITGYLSDVLSYSRLLALGLATGVIALAVNTMAGLLTGHIIGWVIMIPLLLVGHTFNLVINSLGAYIHASRLQYIEFYNRFYEGGGRSFVPFKLNTKEIEIQPEWLQK